MIDPVLLIIGVGTVVAVVAAILVSRFGKFLAQEGPEVPEKSAADLVAELAAQESTGSKLAGLFVEARPTLEPKGPANTLVVYDGQGQPLYSISLQALR